MLRKCHITDLRTDTLFSLLQVLARRKISKWVASEQKISLRVWHKLERGRQTHRDHSGSIALQLWWKVGISTPNSMTVMLTQSELHTLEQPWLSVTDWSSTGTKHSNARLSRTKRESTVNFRKFCAKTSTDWIYRSVFGIFDGQSSWQCYAQCRIEISCQG